MSFDLLTTLTAEDRIKIGNYIKLYGTVEGFIGIDAWLEHWAKNKIKMYKMLGETLIKRIPFSYEKPMTELRYQVSRFLDSDKNKFLPAYYDFIDQPIFRELGVRAALQDLVTHSVILDDKTRMPIKFRLEEANKMLRLQAGTKPIRAISRFLTYCKNVEGIEKVTKEFEKFRVQHSIIMNDRVVKGNLVVSIHPLDFMTMSDNNSNWQSCMSWREEGCYHIGTVEMMNSNNVLCCYLENSEPYNFGLTDEQKKDDRFCWTNKKWRQLVYFTKDIIVSGKSYPYANDDISKSLIEAIRGLAKENLGWTYSFGPELYKDMQYINSSYSMNRARDYIRTKNMTKHNILFDTKGMYNDMLNDSHTKYWCVRNKVKHNKIISYSGKAPCLCCGQQVIRESDDYDYDEDYDYNERYTNCGMVVCEECLDNMQCSVCNCSTPTERHFEIIVDGMSTIICENCWNTYVRKCPDCGRDFTIRGFNRLWDHTPTPAYIQIADEVNEKDFVNRFWLKDTQEDIERNFTSIRPVCMCQECAKKHDFKVKHINVGPRWNRYNSDVYITPSKVKQEDWEKYLMWNLEVPAPVDGKVLQP